MKGEGGRDERGMKRQEPRIKRQEPRIKRQEPRIKRQEPKRVPKYFGEIRSKCEKRESRKREPKPAPSIPMTDFWSLMLNEVKACPVPINIGIRGISRSSGKG